MRGKLFLAALLAGSGLAGLASTALADPPERVGRISYVEGQVSFQPPDDGGAWVEAIANFPVTTGESYWTGDEGRAELELGGAQVRLDWDTEVDVVDLDYGETQLSIAQGSADVHLWRVPENGVQVLTPAGEVLLDQPGVYRIDVGAPDEAGDYPAVEVTALDGGQAQAPGPEGFIDIAPGAAAVIYAGYQPELEYADDAAIDDWARAREAQLQFDRVDWQEEDEPGYADLAAYGQFVQDPDYGQVWFPSDVPPGWQPYYFGEWTYIAPWGWTWVDDQPWGFAPFHYGRWALIGGRWGWAPGQPVDRPVYAPALVAFVGGAGFGVAAGGAFAWVPLAPDEPYIPPYHVSQTYLRAVNIRNVNQTVINNITVTATTVIQVNSLRNASAAVAVSADALSRGARVQQAAMKVSPEQIAQAHVAAPPPPVRQNVGAEFSIRAAAGLHAAAAPPQRLEAVRSALNHAPLSGSSAPPAIPGVHKAATEPTIPPVGAPRLIAPAAGLGREPPPKPLPNANQLSTTGAGPMNGFQPQDRRVAPSLSEGRPPQTAPTQNGAGEGQRSFAPGSSEQPANVVHPENELRKTAGGLVNGAAPPSSGPGSLRSRPEGVPNTPPITNPPPATSDHPLMLERRLPIPPPTDKQGKTAGKNDQNKDEKDNQTPSDPH